MKISNFKLKICKATAIAPSNIAFIKYWGKKDEALNIPTNGSISMNLSKMETTTTVEFSPKFEKDIVFYDDIEKPTEKVIKHLDKIRKLARMSQKAKVVTKNNFPTSTGLSSSASGFAALTLAAEKALGLSLSQKELSILARLGSGSACRSIPDGFVEWLPGSSSDTSYAVSLYPPNYWRISDVVVIVSVKKKDIPTTEGQKLASTSPFFKTRLNNIGEKLSLCKKYIMEKNFQAFGELIEQEALELHSIMFTSAPSLLYLLPETLVIMKYVQKWRAQGLSVYFTVNTGQNTHLIIENKNVSTLIKKLKEVREVKDIIVNTPAKGAHLVNRHLF